MESLAALTKDLLLRLDGSSVQQQPYPSNNAALNKSMAKLRGELESMLAQGNASAPTILSASSMTTSQNNPYQMILFSTILYFLSPHNSSVKKFEYPLLAQCFKEFLSQSAGSESESSGSNIHSKDEYLRCLARVIFNYFPAGSSFGNATNFYSDCAKDLVGKGWKIATNYSEYPSFILFLSQLFQSEYFSGIVTQNGNASAPKYSSYLLKCFSSDLDLIMKHCLVAFKVPTVGSLHSLSLSMLSVSLVRLITNGSFTIKNLNIQLKTSINSIIKKRLSRYFHNGSSSRRNLLRQSTSVGATLSDVESQIETLLLPQKTTMMTQIHSPLFPVYFAASYLSKYHLDREIISGIMENIRLLLIQLGHAVLADNFLELLRFFADLCCMSCVRFDLESALASSSSFATGSSLSTGNSASVGSGSSAGSGLTSSNVSLSSNAASVVSDRVLETSLYRKELALFLLKKGVLSDILRSSNCLVLFGSVVVQQIVEPLSKLLSDKLGSLGPNQTLPLSPKFVSLISFYLNVSSHMISVVGQFGVVQTGSSNVPRTALESFVSLFDCLSDSRITFILFPMELMVNLCFCIKSLIISNPGWSTGAISTLALSALDRLQDHGKISPESIDKLLCSSSILCSIMTAPHQYLISQTVIDRSFHCATQLVKSSLKIVDSLLGEGKTKLDAASIQFYWRKSALMAWIGWSLISAIITNDHLVVKLYLPELLVLFKTFFGKIASTNTQDISSEHLMYGLVASESAVRIIKSFFQHCPSLASFEITKRLLAYVSGHLSYLNGISARMISALEKTNVFRPPHFNYFHDLFVAVQSSAASSITGNSGASGKNSVGVNFVVDPTSLSKLPESIQPFFSISVYSRPYQHYQSLFRDAFEIFTFSASMAHAHPSMYEHHHVYLMRLLMSNFAGDHLTSGTTTDMQKIQSLYENNEFDPFFSAGQMETLMCTSLLRGVNFETRPSKSLGDFSSHGLSTGGAPFADFHKIHTSPENGSHSDYMKTIEGLGPADISGTEISLQWSGKPRNFMQTHFLVSSINNDPLEGLLVKPLNSASLSSMRLGKSEDATHLEAIENLVLDFKALSLPRPLPCQVRIVDSSIGLFGLLFGFQNSTYQEILLDQLVKTLRLIQSHIQSLQQHSVLNQRQVAQKRFSRILVNSLSSLLTAFSWQQRSNGIIWSLASNSGAMKPYPKPHISVTYRSFTLVQELCLLGLSSNNAAARALAGEFYGKMVKMTSLAPQTSIPEKNMIFGGQKCVQESLKVILDLISSSSREPHTRAGAVTALGYLIQSIGAMALHTAQIKTILEVLTTLALDTVSVVHTWALYSYWIILEECGMTWAMTLGPMELAKQIFGLCSNVLPSLSHRPFYEFRDGSDSNSPSFSCPHRSILRIVSSTLSFLGPELSKSSGAHVAECGLSIILAVQRDMNDFYRLLNNNDIGCYEAGAKSINVPIQIQAGIVQPVVFTSLTQIQPSQYLIPELIVCMQHFVTFNAKSVIPAKFLSEIQLWLVDSPEHVVPVCLKRAALRFLWNVIVAAKDDSLSSQLNPHFIDQLAYLLDSCLAVENCQNAGGLSGSLEDDADLQTSQLSPIATQIWDIIEVLLKKDIDLGIGNRWISFAQRALLRSITARAKEEQSPPSPDKPSGSTEDQADASEDPADGYADSDDEAGSAGNGDDIDADDGDGGFMSEKESSSRPASTRPESKLEFNNNLMFGNAVPIGNQILDLKEHLEDRVRVSLESSPILSWRLTSLAIRILSDSLIVQYEFNLNGSSAVHRRNFDYSAAKAYRSSTVLSASSTLFDMNDNTAPDHPVILRINDILKLAFSACSDPLKAERLRIEGLTLLNTLITVFAKCVDPEFPEYSLVEQYQAQINAGLSLAFSNMSRPLSIADTAHPISHSYACLVASTYISSGISPDVSALSRITRILISLIEENLDFSDAASNTLLLSLLRAWSRIFIFSRQCDSPKYLSVITRPVIGNLMTAWGKFIVKFSITRAKLNDLAGEATVNFDEETIENLGKVFGLYLRNWDSVAEALISSSRDYPDLFSQVSSSRLISCLVAQAAELLFGQVRKKYVLSEKKLFLAIDILSLVGHESTLPITGQSPKIVCEALLILDRLLIQERSKKILVPDALLQKICSLVGALVNSLSSLLNAELSSIKSSNVQNSIMDFTLIYSLLTLHSTLFNVGSNSVKTACLDIYSAIFLKAPLDVKLFLFPIITCNLLQIMCEEECLKDLSGSVAQNFTILLADLEKCGLQSEEIASLKEIESCLCALITLLKNENASIIQKRTSLLVMTVLISKAPNVICSFPSVLRAFLEALSMILDETSRIETYSTDSNLQFNSQFLPVFWQCLKALLTPSSSKTIIELFTWPITKRFIGAYPMLKRAAENVTFSQSERQVVLKSFHDYIILMATLPALYTNQGDMSLSFAVVILPFLMNSVSILGGESLDLIISLTNTLGSQTFRAAVGHLECRAEIKQSLEQALRNHLMHKQR